MLITKVLHVMSCCCYHKGTYFQANHNNRREFQQGNWLLLLPQRYVFSSKSQLSRRILFKNGSCCCYHKGTYFQANHNPFLVKLCVDMLLLLPQRYVFSSKSQLPSKDSGLVRVVVATTKVRIFKQITTDCRACRLQYCCCCYHKGTYFQANHNLFFYALFILAVVVATTKVRIFKQITTFFSL